MFESALGDHSLVLGIRGDERGSVSTTIKDIAAKLGVSHVTVSRALRGFPYVSEELRQRILDTAQEMNYRPNALARGLKGMQTQVIGLLIPDLMNDFYAEAATIIQTTLAEEGYRLLLSVSRNDCINEVAYLQSMREERIQGLIWVPCSSQQHVIREYEEEDVPVVQLNRQSSRRVDAVLPDDAGGAQDATELLLALGHVRVAFIVGQRELSSTRARTDGYRRALRAAGLESDKSLIKVGTFDRQWGWRATEELLGSPFPPTAILAASSELVIGALGALDHRGVRVPQEISLVGFGNPDWYTIHRPAITAVTFPIAKMATAVVHTLLQRVRTRSLQPRPKPTVERLGCQLAIRQSVGPPRQGAGS